MLVDLWFAFLTRWPGLNSGMVRWAGYVARWLERLERLTNFSPGNYDVIIDYVYCYTRCVFVKVAMNIGLIKGSSYVTS